MTDFSEILLRLFVLTVALTFHEAAHAWTAMRMGDDTAQRMGRLSLNPFVHMDPLGSLMILSGMPLGWAKPVPVNPMNLRNPRSAMPLVSFAGPLSNILLGVLACVIFYSVGRYLGSRGWYLFFHSFIQINFALAIFNLLPVFPLDGSKIVTVFMSDRAGDRFEQLSAQWGIMPLIAIMALEFLLPGPGIIELWFRFWRPLILPILDLFSVPSYFLW